jgi:hypothetical protein
MALTDKPVQVDLHPSLVESHEIFINFCNRIKGEIRGADGKIRAHLLEQLKREINGTNELSNNDNVDSLFVKNVILDLVAQGWELKVESSKVQICSPLPQDDFATKESVRTGHLLGRDAQLREKSVADFVRSMERRRLTSKGWHSIFSLIRDGRELAENLQVVDLIKDEEERIVALSKTISPYLQFVESEAVCELTGLRLGDIWRYFRHTWVNEYKSIPGRSMMILIRDAAAPNHPVIGIAALGSSVVQHKARDKWIGWHTESFIHDLAQRPTKKVAGWLLDSLESLINSLYLEDLKLEKICRLSDIRHPNTLIITNLLKESERAIKRHRMTPQKDSHKMQKGDLNSSRDYWKEETATYLFRSKRCKNLANLMAIRKVFQEHSLLTGSQQELKEAIKSLKVRSAISQLVRMIKAEHVGIDMMDITVCGAVAPYNLILGGKLVCMMLGSPEVTKHYAKRYANQVSIIASSMKGSPVTRRPNLVLLGTTSLYGVGSSQYNRVKIPAEAIGGRPGETIAYEELGHSYGFGTYHFSRETLKLGSILISRRKDGRLVNSIFGEGVNPLMRKIREALEIVGLRSDGLLQHGNRRVTYGIALARNFRKVLIGLDKKPSYIIPQTSAPQRTNMIAKYWMRRWLSPRISKPEILFEVSKHILAYPISHHTHGAVVPLPDIEDIGALQPVWD